jgi:poly-gamma-glutamate capsule biosynthesis protein CapA/YwtB (metallophosphatase superfamily)
MKREMLAVSFLSRDCNPFVGTAWPRLGWVRRVVQHRLKWALIFSVCLFAVVAFLPLLAQEQKVPAPDFNLTLVGDSIITQPLAVRKDDPQIMAAVNAVRQGDAAFTNVELVFPSPEAPPAFATAGLAADPAMLKDLQWIGFNLFNASNNHSLDYGIQGLRDTIQVYRRAGAVYAGIGENLELARAPGYLATAHGRVALISTASTFSAGAPAGHERGDVRGRPGLSPLRFQTRYGVDTASLETLRKIKADFKLPGGSAERPPSPQTVVLRLDSSDVTFESSDKPRVVTTPDPRDLAEITHNIRDARELSDYVVTYIHAHEGAPAGREVPAQFLVEFAHAAIDAGADVFVASGPHVLRGIEIYKGKLILYSLGNFIYTYDLVHLLPADMYEEYSLGPDALPSDFYNARSDHDRRGWPADPMFWQSVIAHVVFHDGHPARVILTPISIGFGKKRPDRGYPQVADNAMGTEILARLQKLSQPFGTNIAIKDGKGIITIEGN